MKRALAIWMSFMMLWSLVGYDLPAYASEIETALYGVEESSADDALLAEIVEEYQEWINEGDGTSVETVEMEEAESAHSNAEAELEEAGDAEPNGDTPGGVDEGATQDVDAETTADDSDPVSESDAKTLEQPSSQLYDAQSPAAEPAFASDDTPSASSEPALDEGAGGQALSTEPSTDERAATDLVAPEEPSYPPVITDDGMICVSSYEQLARIGTNQPVTTSDRVEGLLGTGDPYVDPDGIVWTYSSAASYYLTQDIALPADGSWQLPDDFTGSFTGPADADAGRVFELATDSIYIQNRRQLESMVEENRTELPVMTGDADSASFGSGQLVYEDENGGYVAYDESHSYWLSAAFTAEAAPAPSCSWPQRAFGPPLQATTPFMWKAATTLAR